MNENNLDAKIATFKENIKTKSAIDIYIDYVMAGDVWVFLKNYGESWYHHYDEFRLYVSKKLDVHYNDIAIAGSGKLGFSINPEKNFKKFDENSDIDIIIISQELFYSFWKEYFNDSYSATGIKNIGKIAFGIFRKYLFLDGFKNSNLYYRNWMVKTRGFEKDLQLQFGIENEIHYRIFESWGVAQAYYVNSIENCARQLEKN